MTACEPFDTWALLELMGHRRIAGRVRETTIAGGSFLRVDIPGALGEPDVTQFYAPGSVYALTPITEEVARAMGPRLRPEPISAYEVPARPAIEPAARTRDPVDVDDDDDPFRKQGF